MKTKVRWGILGAGNIAHKFAKGLEAVAEGELVAVGSRSIEKANEFADKFGIPKRYGSYEELVADPDIDAIYVATPHTFHKEHAILCLNRGKAVLCEKPIAVNAQELQQMVQCARENNVFLMEAMWTRFLPVMLKVQEWLKDGLIGDVRMLTADFGFRAGWNPEGRLLNPELAGGALLDVGVYVVSLASMVFGGAPSRVTGMAHIGESGVDEQSAMILGYEEGQMAILHCAVRTNTPQAARIIGTNGSIYIPSFWNATCATLYVNGAEPEHIEIPHDENGYCYETREVIDCLRDGKIQSSVMSWEESISIMQTMDELRAQWGLKYPVE